MTAGETAQFMATLSIKFQDLKGSKDVSSVKVTLEPLSAVRRLRKHPEKATQAQRMALAAYAAVFEANRVLLEAAPNP